MEFGIFSNGFRPHTSAAQTYDEDLFEIVLADELGFRVAFISEHHGEPVYINRVDTLPVPELLMCKAAGLTKHIHMGAAVKVAHLHHPVDVAIQAAVTDHVIGDNRFIFGFGSGFSIPLFSVERGLTYDDRHARQKESLEFITKCWTAEEPFDWDGKYWKAAGVVATPKPMSKPHMPLALATETEATMEYAGANGYFLLSAHEPPHVLRRKTDAYLRGAASAGREGDVLRNVCNARYVYVTDSAEKAIDDLRAAVTFELDFQIRRGLFGLVKRLFGWDMPDKVTFEDLVEIGWYIVGSPDDVAAKLAAIHEDSGGFGTLLMITGKAWADRERRARSMRLFMEAVAPQLRHMEASRLQPVGG